MLDVTAEGFSSIVPVENAEGKQAKKKYLLKLIFNLIHSKLTIFEIKNFQMLQVVDSNLDFKIGKVIKDLPIKI